MSNYSKSVFTNCPFDEAYSELLRSLLFVISFVGFHPRIASERFDSGESRINKICELIRESQYSIHDLSRIQAKRRKEFYRLNMPFELGIDYGCRIFSSAVHENKKFLVLEAKPYRYKSAFSDYSGFDIKHHENTPAKLIVEVRNWFVETVGLRGIPSGGAIWYKFTDFWKYLYDNLKPKEFSEKEIRNLPIKEFTEHIHIWISQS